ncbi:SDR family NAD(P)-dependent oxidoreductase [Bacteroidota bacterium]
MKNSICLITGGTSGVGKATAMGLAKLGATIILISRSEQRGFDTRIKAYSLLNIMRMKVNANLK